jgi:hypothetical protein
MARSALLAIAIVSIAVAHSRGSDKPSLKDVLRRVTTYVEAYGEKASIVVGTERYTQRLSNGRSGGTAQRSLVAEFAILRAEANHTWIGFRDVIEVDGQSVTDREDRLIDILTTSSGGIDEARQISNESARYNIGAILRNFNVPTAALFFFTPDNLHRFKLTLKNRNAAGRWEIGFRETRKPTLIRTPDGDSVPTEGTLWVDPADGTVVRTHLHLREFSDRHSEPQQGSTEIEVTYRRFEALSMWLPERMTESYLAIARSGSWSRITAHAEYSNYRRFQTSARIK